MRGFVGTTLAAVVLVAGGCTGDGADESSQVEPPTAAEVRPGLVATYVGDETDAEVAGDGECFADAFLEIVSTENMLEEGLVDQTGALARPLPKFSPPTAEAWVDAQLMCIDYYAESTRALYAQSKGKLAQKPYEKCLRAELSEEELRTALVASLSDGLAAPEVQVLSEAQATCAREVNPG